MPDCPAPAMTATSAPAAAPAEFCTQYLDQMRRMRVFVGDFYLLLGRSFRAAPLPAGVDRGAPQQCYANAGRLAIESLELAYCEGYALKPGLFPVHHAWCVNVDGQVVDPTWEFDPNTEYLGVALREDFLREMVMGNEVWGIFSERVDPNVLVRPLEEYLHPSWLPADERRQEFAARLQGLRLPSAVAPRR